MADNNRTWDDCPFFLKDFLIYMQVIQGKSVNTVNEYYKDLKSFLRYLKCHLGKASLDDFENIIISDLSVDDLKNVSLSFLYEYMYYINTVKKNNGNTRARKSSSIKSFFKYLHSKANILVDNPAKEMESPKIPDLLPKYLSLEESLSLLDNIEGCFKERDYCIITIFLNCGIRLSELVGINISDIKEDYFTVTGKGNKQRTIYLNDACKSAINNYLAVRPHDGVLDRDALFLSKQKKRITPRMVEIIVKKALEKAGLDTTKYSVHKLRHTAATLMYKYGNVDVRALQELLGHRQLTTTQIYTHVDDDQLKNAVANNPLSDISKK
ncbi:MAG: tyrosine recombinase XerC [Clostridia bacterium]|nr:tyrosine recombinase XerC [Clostridia bacterium]